MFPKFIFYPFTIIDYFTNLHITVNNVNVGIAREIDSCSLSQVTIFSIFKLDPLQKTLLQSEALALALDKTAGGEC